MHMRGPRDTVLLHGGRQQTNMSTLELIDVSLEDDSLLPPTVSPPEDKQLNCVLRLSPSIESVKKAPEGRQTPISADSEESESKISFSTPKALSEEHALPSDTALSALDVNAQSGSRLTKSEARSSTFNFFQQLTGHMAKSEEKPPMKAVLTPTRARAVSWNNSKSGGDGKQAKATEQPPEKQVDCHESHLSQDEQHAAPLTAEPVASDKPARRTRSVRAMHSLRKSLAWDKAFSTEEGILDGDELSLVSKTPKKLPDLPPLDLPGFLALVSPAAKPAAITMAKAPKVVPGEVSVALKPSSATPNPPKLGTIKVTDTSPDFGDTEAPPISVNGNALVSDSASHFTAQSSTSAITSPIHLKTLSAIPRPVPVTQVIEEAVEKGTKLRLPSSLAHIHHKVDKGSEETVKHVVNSKPHQDTEIVKHRKDSEQTLPGKPLKDTQTLTRCRSTSSLMKPPSTSTSISKKVSSVSKRVKDTLGRVLPGSIGGRSSANRKALAETAHADRMRPVTSVSQSSSTGLKVPGSPGPSYLTRSKSARAATNGATAETNIQKTGVLAELSNKANSSKGSAKLPAGQKKSKGESIWGSIRGRGYSSTRGNENVPQSTCVPSPVALKKTGKTEYDSGIPKPQDQEGSHSDASRDLPSQISKPSGLRLPSPKIGFFDAARTAGIGTLEKSTVVVNDVTTKHGLPPRPPLQPGTTSARFSQPTAADPLVAAVRGYLSSGIPVAPHVTRASAKGGRKGLLPSASAPASPRKNSEMLSPGTHQAVTGRYLTSRSNVTRVHIDASPEPRKATPNAARKLALEQNDGKLRKLDTDAEEAPIDEISSLSLPLGEAVPSTGDTSRTEVSNQHDDEIGWSTAVTKVTDEVEVLPQQPTGGEENRAEGNDDVSSPPTSGLKQPSTDINRVDVAFFGDMSDGVLAETHLGQSNNACLHHLVESLHNSPSIQSTFWNLQESNVLENLRSSDTEGSSNGAGSPVEEKVSRMDDVGTGGGAEFCTKLPDQVCNFFVGEEHHDQNSSELATNASGGDRGRRKSVFGWQDMHASFSSPVANTAFSSDTATRCQQPEGSVSSVTEQDMETRTTSVLPVMRSTLLSDQTSDKAKQENNVRNQEPGQIMNGAVFDELRADSSDQARSDKLHCSATSEKKAQTGIPEKEILQNKLENLFESHWSGWPVLEAAVPASSGPSEDSGVPAPLESKALDGAQKCHDTNCGSSTYTESPLSNADTPKEGRNPLAVNRTVLNTATDLSRLSITPPLKKERGLLALARSAVSRLTSAASGGSSPRDENSRAVDRDGPGSGSFRKSRRHKSNTGSKPVDHSEANNNAESLSPFSEERIRALESAVEEAILMKRGGAVQHSPPNKTQPPPNPWSPVKKGQHLGPFDCTKKTAVNNLVL